jgi:CRISPR-associated protein Cas2
MDATGRDRVAGGNQNRTGQSAASERSGHLRAELRGGRFGARAISPQNADVAVSNEIDNAGSPSPDDEKLLPDERLKRCLPLSEEPLQLKHSTAVDPSPRRRSRGRQGRDAICSKYRMAWVLVFFDLPVGTPKERRDAGNFRKDLIKDGYMMVQFSVYARPCGTADRVETQVRRLKSKIPSKGEVRGLLISDAQWGRMIIMRSQERADPETMPAQMMFF